MRLVAIVLFTSLLLVANGEDTRSSDSEAAKTALKRLNSLVGSWRGVGQVKRGSRSGSWSEKTSVSWDFEDKSPVVRLTANGSKHFDTLKIQWDSQSQEVLMTQQLKSSEIKYRGKFPDTWPGKLVLLTQPDKDGVQQRCTIQQLSEIRATVLLEKRKTPTGSFRRIAAVGYTRAGERLAVAGGNKRKCIVTGGLGTIPVTYEGKTYYVCCEGCLQAFNAAPKAIVAEYKASLVK